MNSSNNPSNSTDPADPWEELADLVGLEGGKEYVATAPAAPPKVEPPKVVAPQPVASPAEWASGAPTPEPIAPRRSTPVAVDVPETVREVLFDETEDAATPAAPTIAAVPEPEPAPDFLPTAEPTPVGTSPVPAAATAATAAQDSYWDALANWNWDDSDSGSTKSKPAAEPAAPETSPRAETAQPEAPRPDVPRPDVPRPDVPRQESPRHEKRRGDGSRGRDDRRDRRGGDRSSRSSGPASPSSRPPAASGRPERAARPPAPAGGDDFGLGIGDEPSDFDSPQPPTEFSARPEDVESDEASGASRDSERSAGASDRGEGRGRGDEANDKDGSGKRRRRRRRRGRGDGEASAAPASAAPDVPVSDWSDSAGPESDFDDEPEVPVAPPSPAPSQEVSGDRSGRPPRGRHRDRDSRREGPPRRSTVERAEREDRFEEEPIEISQGGGAPAPSFDVDDESGEPPVSYDNVPTWEEAISYLLHPNQVQVEEGGDEDSGPPHGPSSPNQPRQNRHVGKSKYRR